MRVACIGGGPGGLYFALLLKKARPDTRVTVVERNAPGDTFGWGVVFSDETLSYLAEHDPPSGDAITKSFAHWDAVRIHYQGTSLMSRGHGFSGISRKRLLEILQARCREVGVDLVFQREVNDLSEFADYDLIVACDGVNSKIRAAHADIFRPSLDVRKAKYIWLGTTKLFDAFTFLFEQNEHGLFQVHGYRFDDSTSTFIVETDEQSWRNAHLDRATTDESISYLEKLFAKYLDGHHLLSNKSAWINFVTVKNERWHFAPSKIGTKASAARIVLLGDAVHTAHFSIGSGTKLAMEDSIALVKACVEHKELDRALAAYDEERRPVVARIQKAAQDSLSWFENVRRYAHFDPIQFAFSLLSRSKRIGYENLTLRDPEFVQAATEHFTQHCEALPASQRTPARPPMFTPFRLRGMTLKNRVVVSPMCMYSADNGLVNDFHLVHLASRAMGGAGLVMTEMTDVSAEGRITPGCAGMYFPEHVAAWKRITAFVHQWSTAKIGLQLGHAGRKGSTKRMWEGMDEPLREGGWPLLAPSPIPYLEGGLVPRAMTRADMDQVQADFVRATKMAAQADFDLLELHMAHGYLLASFLSPLTNHRTDLYGGTMENRMRFPLEVFSAMREAWPEERPMSVRISATDWSPGGISDADVLELARALKEHRCDIVDVSTGQTVKDQLPIYGRMYQTPWSDQIRNEVGIATMTVGNISTHDQINTILVAGRADLCVLARPHLKNPNWTLAAADELGYSDFDVPNMYEVVRPLPKPAKTPLSPP